MNRSHTCCGVMITVFSFLIAMVMENTWERDDKGFVYGSSAYFINASCKKLKRGRSNTGLNAFPSFPIFPFSTYPSGVRALSPLS